MGAVMSTRVEKISSKEYEQIEKMFKVIKSRSILLLTIVIVFVFIFIGITLLLLITQFEKVPGIALGAFLSMCLIVCVIALLRLWTCLNSCDIAKCLLDKWQKGNEERIVNVLKESPCMDSGIETTMQNLLGKGG
jgi:hypothetical protein